MKEVNLAGIDLQNIKVFLASAEHLSFTAAGNELFLTQSAVSKTISSLERSLGLALFEREKGKIALTAAGRILHDRLRGLIREFESAVEQAEQAQQSEQPRLRIGVPNFIDIPQIMAITSQFQTRFPDVSVQVETQGLDGLRRKITRGDLDIIFTVLFEADSLPAADVGWILLDPMPAKVFMSRANPLSARRRITAGDLRGERFIAYSPALVPSYTRMLADLCAAAGFSPVFGRYVENQQSFALALLMNEGILVADDLVFPSLPDGIVGFELDNTVSGKIVAWNRNPLHRHVKAFIDQLMHPSGADTPPGHARRHAKPE